MDNLELTGKVALVTGAANGIGQAIALKLASMGAKLAINDLPSGPEAGEVLKQIESQGGEAMPALASVTDSGALKAAINSVVEKWGQIDILVNNAGVSSSSSILRISEDEWDKVLDVNLRGAFLCSKLVLRSMIGQGWGRIINIASVAGLVGAMGRVHYSASKGGLMAFTRSLATEIGSRNITVNAIAPGFIITRMTEELTPEAREMVLSRTTLKRFGTVHEVAELAAFLATDRASYISGQVIAIDGGIT